MRPKEEAYVGMNDKDTNYMIHGTRKRGHMLLNTTTGKGWALTTWAGPQVPPVRPQCSQPESRHRSGCAMCVR
jgi:hypothetical protein